jgi:uncharacterized BrkB/YihY/UPF0761 family membrane protein
MKPEPIRPMLKILYHYLCIVFLAPLIATLATGIFERICHRDSLEYVISHVLRDVEPSLIVVAVFLPFSIPLSALYHLLLRSEKIKKGTKKSVIASSLIAFPLICFHFSSIIRYNSLYASVGGIIGALAAFPFLKFLWSGETQDGPDTSLRGGHQ